MPSCLLVTLVMCALHHHGPTLSAQASKGPGVWQGAGERMPMELKVGVGWEWHGVASTGMGFCARHGKSCRYSICARLCIGPECGIGDTYHQAKKEAVGIGLFSSTVGRLEVLHGHLLVLSRNTWYMDSAWQLLEYLSSEHLVGVFVWLGE